MQPPMKPVLIAGAGPTGMTAALELGRFGIPVRLVERETKPATTSRAVGVQARTLELFQQRGMADELLRVGNPSRWASIYGGGKRVFRLDFAHVDSRYQYLFFVSQAETEKVLRDHLAQQHVTIEWGVEMVGFTQSPARDGPAHGGVTATLRHGDGRLEGVEASYLVAAGGAHDKVRPTVGVEFGGRPLPDAYALGDLHVDGDLPPSDFHIFSSEHGFMGMFPMGGGRFRIIASNPLSTPSKDTEPSLDELQKLYDQRSHIPATFHDLTWSSWFHINSRMVDRMQVGRSFLAGDAAHIHSPAGAQGMNTGIQDAVNLGWKLAMVLRGRAPSALLDTYGPDRLPVIRNVLTKTEKLTEAIGTENALFRAVFDHVAPLVVGTDFVQAKSTARMSQVQLNYREGPLSETHGHPGDVRGGDRVPPEVPLVTRGRAAKVVDLLDPSLFTLLMANVSADDAKLHEQVSTALAPWKDLVHGHPVEPPPGDDAKAFSSTFATHPTFVLVRPDGYAGYVGPASNVPLLVAYLNRWLTPAGGDHA